MFYFLSFLWFIRETKALLFWLYLWQLKEYHLGRFLDHFRTEKGRKLLFGPFVILKILLLICAFSLSLPNKLLPWQLYASWIFILIILYLFESAKFLQSFFQKTFKKPVLTKKTIILISAALIIEIIFLYILVQKFYFVLFKNFYWFTFWLLSFDILTPLIASIIVFFGHFFTVIFFRNQIIKKAKEKRKQFKNLLVIGIAGSYGKTSTKEFLAEILSEKFKVLKTKEHQNSEVGVSLCILNDLNPEHEVFVCEMGAYNRGGIKLLSDIVKPKIGILTGINEQHMATFGSQENIIQTKFELIQALPEDGLAILNNSDPKIKNAKLKIKNFNSKLKNIKLCSTEEKTDIWTEGIKVEKELLSFKVFSKDDDWADFKLNLLGVQNVENILLAACCAKELGMTLREISGACQKIKPLPHQMELKKGKNNINIIDSTYSANPDGVFSHLEYSKVWPGKKIIIMPCLIELGAATIEVHKEIGQKIGEICDLAIIMTKERFREIQGGAIEKGMKKENILFLENPKIILEKIKPYLKPDNVILLEGRVPQKLVDILLEKPD